MAGAKYKVVLLGEGGVGKSALSIQFVQNHFRMDYDPTIENSYQKQLMVDNELCQVDLLDTAGQEEYAVMRSQYIQAGQGFALVFALNAAETFATMQDFWDQVVEVKQTDKVPIVLIGNKCDLSNERKVGQDEVQKFASKIGVPYFEASAKSRINVVEAFEAVLRLMINHRKGGATTTTTTTTNKRKFGKDMFKGCGCILS